jgi:putative Holliday junction resolvase
MKRALAIDYGKKRIGLAISDPHKIVAKTLTTVETARSPKQTIQNILNAIGEHEVDEIVVGFPIRMNGQPGAMAEEVTQFVALLKQHILATVTLWDERLTTVQAERVMREANMNRKKRSQVIDQLSAVIVLQTFLSTKSHSLLP